MSRVGAHPERRPAVVTGAGTGIGRAIAVALAAAGHPVALGARRVDRCEEVAAAIRAAGGEAVALPLDVTDEHSVAQFVAAATDTLGEIEVLVSNAGDVRPVTVVGVTPEDFAAQLAVNLGGPQALVRAVVPGMVDRARGDVVLVTSEVAVRPRPRMAGYVAAKSGLEGLADALRMELEGTGVRVGVVRPGPTSSEQGSDWDPEDIMAVIDEWRRFGFMRHDGVMPPEAVATGVLAMVGLPRGSSLTIVEAQPEPPVRRPAGDA
ncbi:MAG: SDR family oxidoreductase [Actinomycetes bacterium]